MDEQNELQFEGDAERGRALSEAAGESSEEEPRKVVLEKEIDESEGVEDEEEDAFFSKSFSLNASRDDSDEGDAAFAVERFGGFDDDGIPVKIHIAVKAEGPGAPPAGAPRAQALLQGAARAGPAEGGAGRPAGQDCDPRGRAEGSRGKARRP